MAFKCSLSMLHKFSSWLAEREGLVFKVLYGPNSTIFTCERLASTRHNLFQGLPSYSFKGSSRGLVLGGWF